MNSENTFLIGLGNQKCGTSWLHGYLGQCDNFQGGFAKEYHIWDAVDVPILKNHLVGFARMTVGGDKARQRRKMQRSPNSYFDYFTSLYGGGINLSADITPSYSGLDVNRLRFVRDGFADRGVSTKAIILIRDPVSRIKSAVRYNLDKRNYREGIKFGETDFSTALKQYYPSDHCKIRTSYHKIIPKAQEVFGADNVYVGIYENMFDLSEIEKLSAFCGVATNPDYAKVFVNKTKRAVAEDAALQAEIRQHYDDVYRYCRTEFSATNDLWS